MRKRVYKEIMSEKGFNLLEVMVALVLLGVGLLAMANTQITSIGGNSSGQKITVATTLAQDALEGLTNLPYNTVDGRAAVDGTPDNFDTDYPELNNGFVDVCNCKPVMGVNYTRNYTVDRGYPVAGTMAILVAVNWVDQNGRTHQVTDSTVKRSD